MGLTSELFVQNKDWTLIGSMSVTSSSAYTFTIPSSTITEGTQYTNNGNTYTATAGIAPGTSLVMAGTGAPVPTTGLLSLVVGSGTGPSSITYTALTSAAPVFGTGGVNNVWFRRNGGNAEFRWEYNHTVAGTSGSGQYLFFLANGIFPHTIDTSKLTQPTVFNSANGLTYPVSNVGYLQGMMNTSSSVESASVSVFSNFLLASGTAGSSGAGGPGNIGSGYIGFGQGATESLNMYVSVPIVGWSAYD